MSTLASKLIEALCLSFLILISEASQQSSTPDWQSTAVAKPYQWIRIWAECLLAHIEPLNGTVRVQSESNFWDIIWMTWEIFQDASLVTMEDDSMRFQVRSPDARKVRIFELFWIGGDLKGTMVDYALSKDGERRTFIRSMKVKKVIPIVNVDDQWDEVHSHSGLQFDYDQSSTTMLYQDEFIDCIELQRITHSQLEDQATTCFSRQRAWYRVSKMH